MAAGTLPKTSSGKLQRSLCKQRYLDDELSPPASRAPRELCGAPDNGVGSPAGHGSYLHDRDRLRARGARDRAIWDKVRAAVGEASVAVPLPGFGCQRPAGFGATKDEYVDWLVGELDRIGGPVDLVGHDWGAMLTYRIAAAHGELAPVLGGRHRQRGPPRLRVARLRQGLADAGRRRGVRRGQTRRRTGPMLYQGFGLDADDALELATGADRTMGACILDLYRSADPEPARGLGPWSPTSAPGLVLHPATTPSATGGSPASRPTFGARFEVLDGAGHFWPTRHRTGGRPAAEFWSTLA